MIKEEKIIERALRSSRLDVDYAIFETNGKLSVMPKEPKQPVTKSDMNIITYR